MIVSDNYVLILTVSMFPSGSLQKPVCDQFMEYPLLHTPTGPTDPTDPSPSYNYASSPSITSLRQCAHWSECGLDTGCCRYTSNDTLALSQEQSCQICELIVLSLCLGEHTPGAYRITAKFGGSFDLANLTVDRQIKVFR